MTTNKKENIKKVLSWIKEGFLLSGGLDYVSMMNQYVNTDEYEIFTVGIDLDGEAEEIITDKLVEYILKFPQQFQLFCWKKLNISGSLSNIWWNGFREVRHIESSNTIHPHIFLDKTRYEKVYNKIVRNLSKEEYNEIDWLDDTKFGHGQQRYQNIGNKFNPQTLPNYQANDFWISPSSSYNNDNSYLFRPQNIFLKIGDISKDRNGNIIITPESPLNINNVIINTISISGIDALNFETDLFDGLYDSYKHKTLKIVLAVVRRNEYDQINRNLNLFFNPDAEINYSSLSDTRDEDFFTQNNNIKYNNQVIQEAKVLSKKILDIAKKCQKQGLNIENLADKYNNIILNSFSSSFFLIEESDSDDIEIPRKKLKNNEFLEKINYEIYEPLKAKLEGFSNQTTDSNDTNNKSNQTTNFQSLEDLLKNKVKSSKNNHQKNQQKLINNKKDDGFPTKLLISVGIIFVFIFILSVIIKSISNFSKSKKFKKYS